MPPGQTRATWRRIDTGPFEEPPHRTRRDRIPESREFPVDAPIAPRRVLRREPQNQATQFPWNRRPTGRTLCLGPMPPDQLSMPAQQRRRRHESTPPTPSREQPGQRREHRTVRPEGAWPSDLSAQDHDLVSQHENLGVLGRLLAGQQREPAEEPAENEVEESEHHDWRSSWTFSPAAKATSQPHRRRSRHPQVRHEQKQAGGRTDRALVAYVRNLSDRNRLSCCSQSTTRSTKTCLNGCLGGSL